MTKKADVQLEKYHKAARQLAPETLEALLPGGRLNPILEAVKEDASLRLDIRDGRFNVYYRGGSLLRVGGRGWPNPWKLSFDRKYFRDAEAPPELPEDSSSAGAIDAWVAALPTLREGMDRWWQKHRRGERTLCQAVASANSLDEPGQGSDYLILDLEYQWAQRRLDMIAVRKSATAADPTGWEEPDLVLVEVKSEKTACSGASGLLEHLKDYSDIVGPGPKDVAGILKREFENVVAQKRLLGLVDDAYPFERFSDSQPELLILLIGLDTQEAGLKKLLAETADAARDLGLDGRVSFMQLEESDLVLRGARTFEA